ncbi:WD40-repeat-containing domain protein [Dipodascopsis tothii]|uniref:WD40-repeat-containing domain protein n=1 Tax=Dipodascopsis tothii TaxID=44089 RepID=UPI0034CD7F95
MNLSFVDPFAQTQDYPDNLTHTLQYGQATCLKFNRNGDYLASGLFDGTVVVFDFDTYGIARVLRGHTRAIESLSWTRDGRYLLSSSRDWKCILWDLLDGSRVRTVRFETSIWNAELHPDTHEVFVASLVDDTATLVDFSDGSVRRRQLSSEPRQERGSESPKESAGKKPTTLASVFAPGGDYVFCGTNKGWLNVIETATAETVRSYKIATGNVKQIRFAASGRQFITNSSDRTVRLFAMPDIVREYELEPIHRFQDVVNRLQWNSVGFSANGEYVMASTYQDAHDIYVWETAVGSLVKILEGPKEELVGVEWHPSRTLVAATGLDTGMIYVWGTVTPQRWSALAPDFVEVDENILYDEREDEFDIVPDELANKRKLDREDDIDNVDVVTLARPPEESFVIPIVLDDADERVDAAVHS